MSLKRYLLTMLLGTLLCWGAWGYVITTINPEEAGMAGLLFFYLSLFCAVTGTLSLVGFYIRKIFFKREAVFRHVSIAFRQAIFFAFVVVTALFLQSKNLFTWWNIILLILALTFLEFFFVSRKERRY